DRQRLEGFLDRGASGGEVEQRGIRRLRDRGLRQADLQHEAKRHQEEQHHPDVGRDRGVSGRTGEQAACAHCSSTRQSSGVNQAPPRWLGLWASISIRAVLAMDERTTAPESSLTL